MERYHDIMELLEGAECKLESIQAVTEQAMVGICETYKPEDHNQMALYHLLNVMKDSMVNLRVQLDEIGTAAMLGIKQPA